MGPRGGTLATVGTLAISSGVALLASYEGSSLTPAVSGPPAPPLSWAVNRLHLGALSSRAAGTATTLAMLLAAGVFVYALHHAWRGSLPLRRVFLVAVLLHVLAVMMPLFVSRDVYSYAFYGRMTVLGANPYVDVPADFSTEPLYRSVSPYWRHVPSVYGPAFTLLSAAISAVVSSPAALVLAFKTIAAVASLASVYLAAVAARKLRPERAAFAATLIGWNPVVVFHTVAGGHNDALVAVSLAAAVVLVAADRELLATATLIVATLVKAVAGVPLALAVVGAVARRPPGHRLATAARHVAVVTAIGVTLALPFLQTRDPTLGAFALSTRWLGAAEPGIPLVELLEVLYRRALPWVLLGALAVLIGQLVLAGRRPGRTRVIAALGWAVLFVLLTAPRPWPWYAAWVLPFGWLLPRPARAGIILVSVALAMRTLIAEPTFTPEPHGLTIVRVYLGFLILITVLARLLLALWRRMRLPSAAEEGDPLLIEQVEGGSRPEAVLGWLDLVAPGPGAVSAER